MNTETLKKMEKMRLQGMYRAFKTCVDAGKMNNYTADELIDFLIQSEWDERQNRKMEYYIRNAKFRYKASIEQLHFDAERNIDKNQLLRFADGSFIHKKENILLTGSTGCGKSYIASAIGHQACILGYKVLYLSTHKLMSKLKMAKADGSYLREIIKIEKQDLLILDDFGIQPFDSPSRLSLMEIIEDRHGKKSTIITSQLPVRQWYEVIGEKNIADAVLDRLVHDAHRIELKGESLRKKLSCKEQ